MGHFDNSAGSTLLFITNVIAIIGAAASFFLAGARAPTIVFKEHKWLVRSTLTLCFSALILGTTLLRPSLDQFKQQRSSVVLWPSTLCDELQTCLNEHNCKLIQQKAQMQNDRIRITLNVESDHPIDHHTLEELQRIALAQFKKPIDLDIWIQWVQYFRPSPIPSINPKP